ncbi:membrane-bound alpha-1,6- mannosyltransferase Initiation-specific [Arthrobotrys megalospora]
MLSVKRAILLSAIVLVIFFFTSSQRSADFKSHIRGGPRPKVDDDALTDPSKSHDDHSDKLVTQVNPPHLGQPKSRPSDIKGQPLRDQLAYQFPYDVSNKFPAFIWQTWKYTVANPRFADGYRPLEASWTQHHPDFIHEVITDQVALHLIKHLYGSVPQVLEAFTSLPSPILKADYFRYLILLARGGIYSDIDTAALKPATKWIPSNFRMASIGLVIGIEADPTGDKWYENYSRRLQFCQWTIQSKPGHPVLREVVARIAEKTLAMKRKGTLKKDQKGVIEFTGPAIWTDTVFDYLNDENYFKVDKGSPVDYKNFTMMKNPKKIGDVVVLPVTSFSPGVGQFGAGEDDDPQAFVKHMFDGTWKPEQERHVGESDQLKTYREMVEKQQKDRLKKLGIHDA